MQFEFRLANVAPSNADAAKIREACRMACFAYCLDQLGHEVRISDLPSVDLGGRWELFKPLCKTAAVSPDVLVVSAESMRQCSRRSIAGKFGKLIGFKTSVSTADDERYLAMFDAMVCHEYDVAFDQHPGLLPIPFMVHDRVLQVLTRKNLLADYLNNILGPIRREFNSGVKTAKLRFAGYIAYGRAVWLQALPNYLECRSIESKNLSPEEYLQWLGAAVAGPSMAGDTPKANRFSELAMLGVAIVNVHCPVRVVPAITGSNTILLNHWGDHENLENELNNPARLAGIIENADRAYVQGWSVMGQARQLADWLEKQ